MSFLPVHGVKKPSSEALNQSNSAPKGIWPHLEWGGASEEQRRKAGPLSPVLQMLLLSLAHPSGRGLEALSAVTTRGGATG